MTRTVVSALLSHWMRNPLQLVTFVTGLALATALWSGVQAINAEARASYDAASATLGEGQFDQVVPREGTSIPLDRYVALRRAGWLVSPILEGRVGSVRLMGLDPLTAPGGLSPVTPGGETPFLEFLTPGVIYAHPDTARALPELALRVVPDPALAPGLALTDIGAAGRLLGRDDLSRLIVARSQPLSRPPLASVAPELRLEPARQTADVGELTESFHLNLTAFGLLSFAVGLFIVHSVIGLAFEQRRGVIRTLRTLGVPLPRLVALIALEMLTLAVLAGSIGIVLGYVIAAFLLPDVAATLRGLYGAELTGGLSIRPEWWLSGLGIAVLGTALASAGQLWKIARMPLLASARPRAWAMASRGGQWALAVAGLSLLALAAGISLVGAGLLAGFVSLGALLIGAALLLPPMLALCLAGLTARARGPVSQWALADTRQQLPGLSLALMALLLAIAANIGVSTMVGSFRLAFTSFLDQRLAPELYIAAETVSEAERIEAFLIVNARETLPLARAQTVIAGEPSQILGIRTGPTYRENWTFVASGPAPWDAVAAGSGSVINEQLATRTGLRVGDEITLEGETLTVSAIAADYGNPLGQAVIDERIFAAIWPDRPALQFGARTDDAPALRDALIAKTAIPASAVTDQSDLKAFSLAVFERTFSVTAALNVLTLAVAGFAMLMSLLTLSDLRTPQLAPVWALGLTRRQLGRIELARTVALAAMTAVLALPLGLALAWLLLTVVNVEAFGWRLPIHFFPGDYLRLGLYALAAATLAALWPAWRLRETPPSRLLKVFAHER
ncbi:ABC transporter permease [Cognatishimia sp. F0-27]|uniref:ABC transporter permease n=1 Tax=Cognatishimia sp. F0-27 TaxID=2816855 RepID=UPI001D0CD443|nr:ABC transporter permease [Cognatishimia sp. F0-27]MCC1493093.1 ABC transporter permease [Cognatishimia sp. F0-27]